MHKHESFIFRFVFSILDLVVDMTGIMDRDRGSYGYMRAGVLGYFQVQDTVKG
jgi:hypothetical protein